MKVHSVTSKTKQAGPVILVVALIACLVGYAVGSTRALTPQPAMASESTAPPQTVKSDVAHALKTSTQAATTFVAMQAPKASPTAATANRDVYYPGTENLAADEMRVVALGTGMPTIRPKQAAACFLVELGNGPMLVGTIGFFHHGSADNDFFLIGA